MAFGWPTLFWQLSVARVDGGSKSWDDAIEFAATEYRTHTVINFLVILNS